MKTTNKSKIIAVLGAITCLAPLPGPAQPAAGTPPAQSGEQEQGAQGMRVADSSNLPGENVNDYIGKKITSAQQEDLGTIKDFLLDATSGRIAGVVADTGNAGQLRLLPAHVVKPGTTPLELTAQLDQAALHRLPTVSSQDFEAGNLPAHWTGMFGQGQRGQLLRASHLTGKLVSSDGREAGAIDEVGIDMANGTATLLFRTNPDFAGAQSEFEMPLSRLEFGPDATVTTRLTRADFAQIPSSNISPGDAQASAAVPSPADATAPRTRIWPSTGLTPTGRNAPASDTANTAAAGIRSAIAADPNLVRENISVFATGDKVILRGRASSEAAKSGLEAIARAQAGAGVAVENHVRVGW